MAASVQEQERYQLKHQSSAAVAALLSPKVRFMSPRSIQQIVERENRLDRLKSWLVNLLT